ncbi:MAG: TraR/DksA C4-type zinc finger protein [Ignavibacteriales bacterium]|nr:TraR/DksA C4-type zinc finger protein [Ignavibacteriales bacterium]
MAKSKITKSKPKPKLKTTSKRILKKNTLPKKKTIKLKPDSKTIKKSVKEKAISPAPSGKKTLAPKKKNGYSKTDLKYFKKLILEKRAEVREDLQRQRENVIDPMTGEYHQESSLYSLHMEHGTDSMEREKAFLLVAREARFLENLNDALARIELDNYGWCKDCGKLINKWRLEAVPHAQLCADCKNKRGGTPQES